MLGLPSEKRGSRRLLRLLTFVCFFQFSGLNNGYTYLSQVRPVEVQKSVSTMAVLVRGFYAAVAPQLWLRTVLSGRDAVVLWTLRAEAAVRSLKTAGSPPVALDAASPGQMQWSGRSSPVLAAHADYLPQKREVWTKRERPDQPDAGLEFEKGTAALWAAMRVSQSSVRGARFEPDRSARIPRLALHYASDDASAPNRTDSSASQQTSHSLTGLFLCPGANA